MVHEFQGCSAGAGLHCVDQMNPDRFRLDHRLADRQEFPGVADAKLESGGLAADSRASRPMKHHSSGVENARGRRRDAVSPIGTPLILEILPRPGRRQHPAMRLGALATLSRPSDLIVGRDAGEFFRIERAVTVAAAK